MEVYPRVGGGNATAPPWRRLAAVYPRVGGGNGAALFAPEAFEGLSPRGRGKRPQSPSQSDGRRSIPAWAGETMGFQVAGRPRSVYPRVGGGNPRRCCVRCGRLGLSPRGRGKLGQIPPTPFCRRSIPAWAGETRAVAQMMQGRAVYPRVGGGNLPRRIRTRTL